MKITKKDKILLASLLVILVLGIFIMYGIVPAYQDLKAQEETLATLQAEVAKLKANYNRNNPKKYLDKIEKALMNYYLNESEIDVAKEEIDVFVDFDKEWRTFSRENNLVDTGAIDTSTIRAVVKNSEIPFPNEDSKDTKVAIFDASVVLGFEYEDIEGVYNLLDVMTDDKVFQFSNFNVSVEEKNYSTVITGSFTMTKTYLRETNVIPLPVVNDGEVFDIKKSNDAPTRRAELDEGTTVVYEKLEHAESYQIVKVKLDENGEPIGFETSRKTIEADPNDEFLRIDYKGLQKGRYVVMAVGNYMQDNVNGRLYYRTIESKYLYENVLKFFTVD